MPHLIFEYSSNVREKNDFPSLFAKCHAALTDILPTQQSSCMSRAIEQKNYFIGDGDANNAFVALNCKVLKGRTQETLQLAAEKLMALMQEHFSSSLQEMPLKLSVELGELASVYVKNR